MVTTLSDGVERVLFLFIREFPHNLAHVMY